jgi:hypothetical protein
LSLECCGLTPGVDVGFVRHQVQDAKGAGAGVVSIRNTAGQSVHPHPPGFANPQIVAPRSLAEPIARDWVARRPRPVRSLLKS